MVQATVLDGLVFDAPPFSQDGFAAPEVDVRRGQVANTLMVTVVVIMVDEGSDSGLQFPLEEVVLEKDAVFEGLVPSLDLALGLRVIRCTADVLHLSVVEPFGEVSGEVA